MINQPTDTRKPRMTLRSTGTIFLALTVFATSMLFEPLVRAAADTGAETTETIAIIRHGEKPPAGLGQLSCQGLNRALALPPVLRKAFGIPSAIFAPNPAEKKSDNGTLYDYVRPLATIEPTAIAFGLPINSAIGQSRIDDLRRQLDAPIFREATVLVAWEHTMGALLARKLMKQHGGDPSQVPEWKGSDFDSIYTVRIRRSGAATTASFELGHEGLDGQSASCPGEAR
jgi:hypothetical protein